MTGIAFRHRAVSTLVAAVAATVTMGAQHQRPSVPPERLLAPTPTVAKAGEVGVLPVQGNIYLLNLGDVNIVAQVGDDGILRSDVSECPIRRHTRQRPAPQHRDTQ